ncbi:histidine phosphatase family protein [Thauera mechernichensis]
MHADMSFVRSYFVLVFGCLAALGLPAVAADVPPARSSFEVVPASPAHIEALRGGGFVIYMRHGATDARFPDRIPVQIDDCASQRPLSDAGRAALDRIGTNFARLGVPYSKVISSPFCRARESASRVFQAPVEVDPRLMYTATMSEAEKAPAVARTREWLSTPVDVSGDNRVVVAHGPNIAEIMDYLPREATMVIFRPLGAADGGAFEYVASIEPGHWVGLLQALGLEP